MSAARGKDAIDPARSAAYEVLRRTFEHDAWTDRAFPAAAERHGLTHRARARAQWLAYGAVQRRGTSDHIVSAMSSRTVERLDGSVIAALRVGIFELLWAGSAADHAVVTDAVELAKRGLAARGHRRAQAGAGFVNALLRRVARERAATLESLTDGDPASAAVAHSCPEWLARMWWDELGAGAARALMRASNDPLPAALRANTLRAAPDELRARLAGSLAAASDEDAGLAGSPLRPREALLLDHLDEAATAALEQGEALAQSLGAQAVVEVLDPRPGERILDLCAGPGIKTVAIAARMRGTGELVAVEADPGRARQVEELCTRAGAANVRVVPADAREDIHLPGGHYDRVLVDPPCSDLGTLASRPDARWRKSAETVTELAPLQREILASGLSALAPSGTLVYSTCTISRRENEDVALGAPGAGARIDDLGRHFPGLASPHDGRFLQTRPDRDRTDGFFIARMTREGGPA